MLLTLFIFTHFTSQLPIGCTQQLSGPLKDLAAKIVFSKDYSIHEAPRVYADKPLLVNFSINLRNVLSVDEKQQIITLETSLRLYWEDPRIAVLPSALSESRNYVTFNPKVAEYFWIPDIFIDKSKAVRVPTYFVKPASLRVYNDSTVRYSSRLNFDVACEMDFHRFPVDEQLCEIKFESFGFTTEQLMFSWKKGSSNINQNISLAQFDMNVKLEDTYETDYYELAYPGLIMKIHLRREIGYHIVQTYIPSMIFVFVAWLSLFISPESIPGRVGMGMTTLLTLTAMFGAVRNNVPKVSYVSYLDIWMVACIFFFRIFLYT
ncbi:GLRA2 [Lepeophtheirus salmonis]|uniref:GLRA2 n=1 Tax=Lepeophtheirus salmonis TaxID=72036 RepID=A0A7R8HBH7_LEPSM|nr:GLRA2 [Lepeophtheirus salmonis]CAF2987472.1 GLRA2 [Lepeophtheirus salmonis]